MAGVVEESRLEEQKKAELANLTRICGFLMQTKICLFVKRKTGKGG